GNAHPRERVERLASETDALVIVDEAYVEFGGDSAAPLIAQRPNVVVVRTFSKAFALAGARVGYCLADPDVVENLRRVRLPYHLSALTQAAGLTALEHLSDATAISTAAETPTRTRGCRSSTTCSSSSERTRASTSPSRRRATWRSTRTTPWRTPASRSARRSRRHSATRRASVGSATRAYRSTR